jgi:hypothetical protein
LNYTAIIGAGDAAEAAGGDERGGRREVDLVEQVKEFAAQLQAELLPDGEFLHDGDVRIGEGRAADDVAAGIAIDPARDEIGWYEGGSIEESGNHVGAILMTAANVIVRYPADQLSALEVLLARTVYCDVGAHSDVERGAALEGVEDAKAPVAEKASSECVPGAEFGTPEPTRV